MSESNPRVRHHEVLAEEAGQRIDNFLLRHLKGLPRSRVYRLLRRGEVRVDGGRARPTRRLRTGEVVRIPPVTQPPQAEAAAPPQGLAERLRGAALYEDERLLVLDKPSGLAVHGGSSVGLGLIEAMRQLRPELRFLELAHRLDQETSGCLMLAKRRSTLRRLHEQLRHGRVEKRYTALLTGALQADRRRVEAPLERLGGASREHPVRVSEQGRKARTAFEVLRRYRQACLVDVQLGTGRTHQIRVHARHLGHPVAGDDRYGDRRANAELRRSGLRRLFLHAAGLQFHHPDSGEAVSVEAPLSGDLQAVLETLAAGEHHKETP